MFLWNRLNDELEFGVDLRMFDNKLSIDATYYDNETLGDIVELVLLQHQVLEVHLQILVISQTRVLNYLLKVR